ncbi:hypothetical protein C8F01DRAFT_85686 [Mycena amicta]|nr:hypothetical protein C8F01DRAFT_85686 [Mycena amicta]
MNPYWNRLHEALDATESDASVVPALRSASTVFVPGDLATTTVDSKIVSVFLEFLQSKNIELTVRESAMLRNIAAYDGYKIIRRPCVVLNYDPRQPAARIVCFLASANSSQSDTILPLIRRLAVPFGNNVEAGLAVEPPLASRMLFALPVVRQVADLRTYRQKNTQKTHNQLAYGELERARAIVRNKIKYLYKNLDKIRAESKDWYMDRSYAIWSFRATEDKVPRRAKVALRQPPSVRPMRDPHRLRFHGEDFSRILQSPPLEFPSMDNCLTEPLRMRRRFLYSASSYLSSALPSPAPPFHLPPAAESSLRRTGTYLARRIP